MHNGLRLFKLASALAGHASARQGLVAQNIANADTPGYRATDLTSFSDAYGDGASRVSTGALRATRPGHLDQSLKDTDARAVERETPGERSPNGNSVSIETEMMKASEIRHSHELALTVYRNGMTLLRTGLGRG